MSCRPGDLSVRRGTLRTGRPLVGGTVVSVALVWAEPLVVDPDAHADERVRFESNVVRGPGADDCAIWVGAIGADGSASSPSETAYTPVFSDQ